MGIFTPGAYGAYQEGLAGQIVGNSNTFDTFRAGESFTPGFPVFGYKGNAGINDPKRAFLYHKDTAKIVLSTALITANSTIVTVNGVATAAVVFATDALTTMNAIVNAIKALAVSAANPYGVEAVLDNTDTNNLTVLIRTQGVDNTSTWATTLGSSQPTVTVTVASGQVFLGIPVLQPLVPTTIGGAGSYVANDPVSVCVDGEMFAEAVAGSYGNGKAFIDATTKKFGPSGEDSGARFRDSINSANIAKVRITSAPYGMTYADRF
jgi:hypothetical protein